MKVETTTLKFARDEKEKALKAFIEAQKKENGYDFTDGADVEAVLNELNQGGIITVSFDWFGNIEDRYEGSVEAVYYSHAIGKTIVLNYDGFGEFKSTSELVDFIMKLEDQAEELEQKLTASIPNDEILLALGGLLDSVWEAQNKKGAHAQAVIKRVNDFAHAACKAQGFKFDREH